MFRVECLELWIEEYTATGYLSALTDGNDRSLWRTLKKNAAGQIERYMTGDSLITNRSYEPETGRLLEILTLKSNDTIQKNTYEYDKIANLAARIDHVHNMNEEFIYDKLNRLTGIVEDGDTTACFDYDAYGRMLRKYMHSALVFDSAVYNAGNRPHAIAQAHTFDDLPLHRMRYTHFDKLSYLVQDTLALNYQYGYDHQRIRMTEVNANGDTLIKKEYVGNCEFVDNGLNTTSLTYISGPLGVFGVREQRGDYRPNQFYIHPDHLGSWTLVTDSYANIQQDVVFDVWGTPYGFDEIDTTVLVPVQSLLFDRGFTGHEHLLYFGLINMNGRMYDPFISGFLSVDNYVQSPDYTQSFNRYAYCLNNPLKYTDPDGEFWNLVIGAAIGGIANLASNWGKIDTFGEGLAYFGIGAAAGALGAATGGAAAGVLGTTTTLGSSMASGAISGSVGGFTSGFTTGAGNAMIQGCNIGEAFAAGMTAGGKSALIGGAVGGAVGGIQYGRTIRAINKGCKNAGITEMSQVNDGNLRSLQKQWYSDVPMEDYVVDFTIDNVPSGELEIMMAKRAAGKTVEEVVDDVMTGRSSVYFNRMEIPTIKDLYFTMGHEFVHVGQISTFAGLPHSYKTASVVLQMEVGAYAYSCHLGQEFAGNPISFNEMQYLRSIPFSEINKLNWMNFKWLWNPTAP